MIIHKNIHYFFKYSLIFTINKNRNNNIYQLNNLYITNFNQNKITNIKMTDKNKNNQLIVLIDLIF